MVWRADRDRDSWQNQLDDQDEVVDPTPRVSRRSGHFGPFTVGWFRLGCPTNEGSAIPDSSVDLERRSISVGQRATACDQQVGSPCANSAGVSHRGFSNPLRPSSSSIRPYKTAASEADPPGPHNAPQARPQAPSRVESRSEKNSQQRRPDACSHSPRSVESNSANILGCT
jgi:hypothetical protein